MHLLKESCLIYLLRTMTICMLAFCQAILIGPLYLGPLEISFFNLANLALEIIPRLPVKIC